MSKYTITIAELCYQYIDFLGEDVTLFKLDTIDNQLKKCLPYFFNFDFPIYDESKREELEIKFLKHFYAYEIGSETFTLFNIRMNEKFNLLMPYYNELFKSVDLLSNPLSTVNMTETSTSTGKNNAISESNQSGHSTSSSGGSGVYSDYPQTLLNDLDYATSGNKEQSTGTSDSTENTNGTSNSTSESKNTLTRTGNQGYSENILLSQYRSNLLNIEQMLFNDLQDLFLGVY